MSDSIRPSGTPRLRRVLTYWPLVLYGLGVIVGAGIYVATGAVIERAERAALMPQLMKISNSRKETTR